MPDDTPSSRSLGKTSPAGKSPGASPSEISSGSLAESAADDSMDAFLEEAAAVSDPAPSAALAVFPMAVGEIVGNRFRIEGLAGSGGMGAVYRAADLTTGARAAVKVIGRQSASIRARFSREGRVLAELSHPAIVRYLAHGVTGHGHPFLAMDWLEGMDLAHRLARAPIDVDDSFVLLRRACEGLAVAHAHGIVHRDIKPSNLFLPGGDPARVKVIDFGVARFEEASAPLTRRGSALGTAGYMAPEQALEAADVDARADVYALGCVLFECLTGRPPFLGRHASLLVKVIREKPPRPSDLRPGLGVEVDALMGRLLAKDRTERPGDAAEMLLAVDAVRAPPR